MDEEASHLGNRGKSVTGRKDSRYKGPEVACPHVHERTRIFILIKVWILY